MSAIVALALTALWVAQVGAKPKVTPPNSKAFGKTMAEWLTIYWRWLFEGGEDKVGNVLLLPMPSGACEGEGTEDDPSICVGELDITIDAGTAFVLPLFAWIGERYEGYPEVPDDEPIPDELLIAWTHPNLTLDGQTIVSDENKEAFYVGQTLFDPPIVWAPPSPAGLVWFQGFGIVCPPLSEGEHVLHLYEPFSLFGSYFGVYDNTWNITVVDEDDNDD